MAPKYPSTFLAADIWKSQAKQQIAANAGQGMPNKDHASLGAENYAQ
jgi:hypothetical protein